MKWCTRSSSSKWQNEIKLRKKKEEQEGGGGGALEWGFATSTQNSWIERQPFSLLHFGEGNKIEAVLYTLFAAVPAASASSSTVVTNCTCHLFGARASLSILSLSVCMYICMCVCVCI